MTATLRHSSYVGDLSAFPSLFGNRMSGQVFTPAENYSIYACMLRVMRNGDCGDMIVEIQAAPDGLPEGVSLCSGVLVQAEIPLYVNGTEWAFPEIVFDTNPTLMMGTQYAVIASCPTGIEYTADILLAESEDDVFAGGTCVFSTNGGETWTKHQYTDKYFEIWGDEAMPVGEYIEILTADRALALDNITEFTPSEDYHPATKKYVDDAAAFDDSLIPDTDDAYWIGEAGTPFKAIKGLVIKDTTDGKHYKITVISGVLTATALD